MRRSIPATSGGPLLDSHGNVIGINTAIYGSGNMGIGFAMPINRAKAMIEDYKAGRRSSGRVLVSRSRTWRAISPRRCSFRLKAGLLVQGIERGSARGAAGLRGPRQMSSSATSRSALAAISSWRSKVSRWIGMTQSPARSEKRPGDKLELLIFRSGRTQKISVTLTEDPGDSL